MTTDLETIALCVLGAFFAGVAVFLAALAKQLPKRRNPAARAEAERIARTIHTNCACGRVIEFRRKP